jgi:hypothetical protein
LAAASADMQLALNFPPCGSVRYTCGATPTDYRFTGQRLEQIVSLID